MHLKMDHEGEKERKQKDTINQKKEGKKSGGNVLYFFLQKKAILGLLLLFSCQVMSDAPLPHELHHARLPCPSLSPRVYSNSCPLSECLYLTISPSVAPFSFYLQSFTASGPFPLGLTDLILQCKGHSRIFSNTTIQKYQLTVQFSHLVMSDKDVTP